MAATAQLPVLKDINVVIIGDSGVGKSALVKRFANDTFDSALTVTIGVEYLVKNVYFDDRAVQLKLWDTSGLERFRTITTRYIRGSSVAIVVYDITDSESFRSISQWINTVRVEGGSDLAIVLVGNKREMSDRRQVSMEEASRRAKTLNIIFMETSAKSGHNVEDLFEIIAMGASRKPEDKFPPIGDQFLSALDQYIQSCSHAQGAWIQRGRLNNTPKFLANLDRLSNDITSHIQRLQDVRVAINKTSNSTVKVAPINSLPPEILARIFCLVASVRPCFIERDRRGNFSQIKYPLYPDALSHVSSFWRRVAIGTPSLWAHIDITLDRSLNPGPFARAKVYATRAGQLPLEIHIIDPTLVAKEGELGEPEYDPSHNRDYLPEFEILTSDAVPIKSLELDMDVRTYHQYREIYYSALEYFFARSIPGVLKRYVVRCFIDEWIGPHPFIEPVDMPYSLDGALLAIPSARLDKLWLPISTIRISGLCPHWKSKAYYGLVELYIDTGIPYISETDLFGILRASPKLQVLHIKTTIGEPANDTNREPAYLEDLRDLRFAISWDDRSSSSARILRRIAPGKKPLQLAYLGPICDELVNFFSRANVNRFYTTARNPHPLHPVLNQPSRLNALVLDGLDFDLGSVTPLLGLVNSNLENVPPSTTQIDSLYLLRYIQLNFEEIQAVVKMYSVQRLVVYGGAISYQTHSGRVLSSNLRNTRIKLSSISGCQSVKYQFDPKVIEDDCDDWIVTSLSD
ncbi:unnamed protein product [Rhizoctonia solani]|uniref:Uncharacterized protein n=1 Tax=Rhizoctonia solani TaxID=456999 RepID=A0A8H3BF92_9AGAM|nr:unnamed protein product [Rhizoctonia solani]